VQMRWEDERYVRLYTRNTVGWLAMGWEARCTLTMLFRVVDRAGLIELGTDGVPGLAIALQLPEDVVRRGLDGLLGRGTVEQHGTTIVIPNFIDAQECRQSDAARQRKAREVARDLASVTNRDEVSRAVTKTTENVTRGHTASQPVTPSLAVPSRTNGEGAQAPTQPKVKKRLERKYPESLMPTEDTSVPGWCELWSIPQPTDPTDGAEVEKFVDHFRANGKPLRDWSAAWRNWKARAAQWSQSPRREFLRVAEQQAPPYHQPFQFDRKAKA